MRFQYYPEAARELTRAIGYYEEKSEGLGAEFLDEVENVIARIQTHPDSGTLLNRRRQTGFIKSISIWVYQRSIRRHTYYLCSYAPET